MVLTGYTHRITVPLTGERIIAPEHAASGDPAELAAHCLEAVAPDFAEQVRDGDLLVVDAAIEAGGDQETAALALQAAGISAVVCVTADEGFVAQAQSYGLPVLACPEAAHALPGGALVRIDLARGTIEERASGARWHCTPPPPNAVEAAQRTLLHSRMRRVVEEEGFAEGGDGELPGRVERA